MKPDASIRPTTTGASPILMALSQGASLTRSMPRQVRKARILGGTTMAKVETSMPAGPATCQPIRLTMSILGPGAIWASATAWTKAGLDIQPCTSTIWR